eukprot:TRINITY_DN2142_c0_g1_i1.p1 TRINITY_DN2142_c0_g1~~TRINITY_DN2142_c0_g1_i1.p1  ORF type:complete len:334 (+),score=30.76 TRINITY_DN2142_c0_g1_i1:581-1582(+)
MKILVYERYDQQVQPLHTHDRWSVGNGDFHARVWFDKNAYMPGELVVAKLKINNTSTSRTPFIAITLHHHLKLCVQGWISEHTTHVHESVYSETFTGLPPCFYGVRWISFRLPQHLPPSTSLGPLSRSGYAFSMEFGMMDGSILNENFNLMPITLIGPQQVFQPSGVLPLYTAGAPLPPNVNYRPEWQEDETATVCSNETCNKPFSFFNRRHHCRHCFRIFCADCTSKKTTISKLKFCVPVRVCDSCYSLAQAGGVKLQTSKAVMAEYQHQLERAAQQRNQLEVPPSLMSVLDNVQPDAHHHHEHDGSSSSSSTSTSSTTYAHEDDDFVVVDK